MNELSNPRTPGGQSPPAPAAMRLATAAEMGDALTMILTTGGRPPEPSQVSDFIRFAGDRGIDIGRVHVLISQRRMLWGVLPIVNPGKTALLLGAPAPARVGYAGAISAGIDQLCRQLANQNIDLAQVLLDPTDLDLLQIYEDTQFRRMAELIYLHRKIRRAAPPPPIPESFALQTYSAANHVDFARAILASYEQSLDCPGLSGLRNIEDVIAGHKASGEFDPADWFLLTHNGQPSGALLLNRTAQLDGMELVYLGLAPWARGGGWGDHLMLLALHRVAVRKMSGLTLAVDSQNIPALRLYHRHGLERIMNRIALMRDLRPHRGAAVVQ